MDLTCHSCGAPFRSEDLNLEYGIATCRFCHAVTKLPRMTSPDLARADDPESPAIRPRVPKPDGITVEDYGHGIKMSRRWFSPVLFFLLFFCIAWDSFLIFWYSMAFGMFGRGPGAFGLLFIIFPIAHVAVGVGLTYFVIAGFLNRTTIEVAQDELRVRHGPVPWKGNRDVPVDDIDQIYCQEEAQRTSNGGSNSRYKVNLVLKDGRKLELLGWLTDRDHALFIEQALEEHLRIEHRRVAGELTV